ncbi:MAG: hypothetical protein JF603_04285 [Acidobacteria bacterium]|nr:hypothetical protein [Acidobacteriota bacterium]
MRDGRDRWIAGAALGVLLILALLVGLLVRDAQNNAIESRERLREEFVQQLARQMESRVQSIFPSLVGFVGKPGQFTFRPDDPADRAQFATLFAGDPGAGGYLLDRNRTIVNGILLRPPGAIGTKVDNPALDVVYEGTPTFLPVGPSYTTTDPVVGLALPTRDTAGRVDGVFVFESAVASDSSFSKEVVQLRAGDSGVFAFFDRNGVVVASNNESALARPIDRDARTTRPGGLRRVDGKVIVVARVPSAGWTLAFEQRTDEFQGDVTGPVRRALLLLMAAAAIAGSVLVIALVRRLRAAREEQRRLAEIYAAREEFTSIVSHELRTPVAGLVGFLETAVDHWEDMSDADRKRAVQRSYANARTLRSLTADVLDSTSIEAHSLAMHPEAADLRAVVDESAELVRMTEPDRVIAIDEPAEPVPVHIDASRIGQVVSNLLDNAIKGSPAGSPVDVTVTVEGGEAVVRVQDRGSGIAAADLERVFEKFVRGAGVTGRGSGLGLYIARHLVEAHGGRIWVEPTTEVGACISFTVPLAQRSAAVAQ